MEPREIKGLEIAAKLKLVRTSGNIWYVPSQSNKQEKYTVTLNDENPQCTCRDYEIRSRNVINTGLLVAAVLGIALTLWQVRSGVKTQRAQFLKDLYSTWASDADALAAYYHIEYGNFEYGADFHGSDIEPKIDRLLAFSDLVAELELCLKVGYERMK